MPAPASEIKPDPALALAYLRLLWPDPLDDTYLLVWTLDHHADGDGPVTEKKCSRWFRSGHLESVAQAVRLLSQNVYIGSALSPTNNGPHRRCEAGNVIAIPGLWADVDIAGPAHKGKALPPDLDASVALARSMPLPPSLLVRSGHGVYPWWLFKEPWIFDDDGERQEAAALAKQWEDHLHGLASERRWRLDTTSAFARVLRLPGSVNRKHDKKTGLPCGDPVLVTVEIPANVVRYDPKDVRDALPVPRAESWSRTFTVETGPTDRELALSALAGLSASRAVPCSGEGSWLDVGMCLHSVADDLLDAWDDWSRRCCPEKYEPGVCAAKWKTFTRGGGLTLGSLVHWARADGWIDPRCKNPAAAEETAGDDTDGGAAPPVSLDVVAAGHLADALLDVIRTDPYRQRAWRRLLTEEG
jgi:hypothetical protein